MPADALVPAPEGHDPNTPDEAVTTTAAGDSAAPFAAQFVAPIRSCVLLLALGLLLVLGAWLRLHALGEVDLRGDEVTHFLDLESGVTTAQSFQDHWQTFGYGRQMPLPRVLGAWVIHAFDLEVDRLHLRLPFALAGIATVLACWLLGWRLTRLVAVGEVGDGGKALDLTACRPERLAGLLAGLAAIQPYSVYWSRTAHIYAYPMLFLTLALACAVAWLEALEARRELRWDARLWLAGVLGATILASYSHMSAWLASGLLWLALLGAWWVKRRRAASAEAGRGRWPRALGLLIGLWALSLTPWAWAFLAALWGDGYDKVWSESANPITRFTAMWRLPFVMSWGGGWRTVASLGLPLLACGLGWRHPRWGWVVRCLLVGGASLFGVLTLAQTTGFFAFRYYVPLWPLVLLASGLGVLLASERLGRWATADAWLVALAAGLGLAMVTPLGALLALRGNPVEFTRLSETLDELVAEGTPVLVNGMNVVRYEMRPHLPERAQITYTVPDVGFAMWKENRWRETAEEFLRSFPQAPLVQQGRNYYDHPEVGAWDFPERAFTRQLVLRNEPVLLLRRLVLGASEEFYTGSEDDNRATVRIHYNTTEDLIERARRENRVALALFGDGWGYSKSEDLASWRRFDDRADLRLFNWTGVDQAVEIVLSCQSAGGRKEFWLRDPQTGVTLGDRVVTPLEGPFSWRVALTLAPGERRLELIDRWFEAGRQPLLVRSLEVRSLEARSLGASGSASSAARQQAP